MKRFFLTQRTGRWAGTGPGVGVKADDPAAGPAAIDHDRAHFGRFRRAALADGIDGLDLEMKALGNACRDGPDKLPGVLLSIGNRLPGRARLIWPP